MDKKRIYTLVGILMVLVVPFFFLDLFLGSAKIPIKEIVKIIFGEGDKPSWGYIIIHFRLPKALTAILCGAGLSIAGLIMQTLFRNPLAGPFVLGISSGASLGVALYVMASYFVGTALLAFFSGLGSWGFAISAMTGASLVFFLILMASVRVTDSVSLLIIGIMFGSVTGAVVSILQYFSPPEVVQSFLVWTFGSLGGVTWTQLKIMIPVVLVGIFASLAMQKGLNALLLGENYAASVGTSVKRLRLLAIVATSLLAGVITAFTGPIAFVGVAVPHIARQISSTSDHKYLLPASAAIGAIILLVCDMISQLPGEKNILPINSVTAIFGAPVVIWVIMRSKRIKGSF